MFSGILASISGSASIVGEVSRVGSYSASTVGEVTGVGSMQRLGWMEARQIRE